ncbi:PF20097 family protein [Butyrivibrio fibrisolvens]|uniref:PF20097 family protein n=1 Tax=Butyrivibrio fibrisolvens TaxID=831 RepID=UPI0003B515F6
MICPSYSGKEIKEGVLRSFKGLIKWGEATNTIDWLGLKIDSTSYLENDKGILASRVTSYYCPDCKKMIIDTDLGNI